MALPSVISIHQNEISVSTPKVACIVLNYNGLDITVQAVRSLRSMDYPSFDILHVDNGSTDGSAAAVQAADPESILVRVEENQGPAGGLNLGMYAALEQDYDYLLFLNNDIEVEPNMLTEMVRVAESDPTIGCVGPKAYYYWERERIWSAGGIVRFKQSVTRERGDGEIDRGQYDRDDEVDYATGCALMMKRSAVEAVGYWDPAYRFAAEDADLCMRARRAGFRSFFAHKAVLYHMVAYTGGAYVAKRTFHTGRGGAIFTRRYGTPWQKATFLGISTVALPAAFLRELPKRNHGAAVAKARGIVDGWRTPVVPPLRVGEYRPPTGVSIG